MAIVWTIRYLGIILHLQELQPHTFIHLQGIVDPLKCWPLYVSSILVQELYVIIQHRKHYGCSHIHRYKSIAF